MLCLFFIISIALASANDNCNEMICGSVVSKCLLTQSCQCKLNDCHCCKDCLNCLGDLYTECCGCLDMCPKHKDTIAPMPHQSEIGDVDGVPELFDILTSEDDYQWSTIRFSVQAGAKPRFEDENDDFSLMINSAGTKENTASPPMLTASSNCTVIYLNSCIRSQKCLQQCQSMGANSYRWFHDGCCECVGSNCLNYGINESRCNFCPEIKQANVSIVDVDEDHDQIFSVEDPLDGDMWDYDEIIP